MNKNSVVGIYIRVSTEEQKDGFSLEAQKDTLLRYAEQNNFDVYDVYDDGGFSGKDFNRPNVQRMFKDLQKNKIDTILVWKVDRLSRNNTDVLNLIDNFLRTKNKRILVSTGDIDSSTTTGYMFISLLSTFARYERETLVDRVKSGMEKRAEQGEWNGGRILGYDNINKKLVINPDEAKIVKKIFELRAENWGYKKIANYLNHRGKKTKNKNLFKLESVKTIVNNEMYTGKSAWGKQRDWSTKRRAGVANPITSEGLHKAIIDIDLWNKVKQVNSLQKETYSSNRNFNGNFFLSGVLKCPRCGASTVMNKVKKRNGEGYHLYYMCQAYHSAGKAACNSNLIKKEWIEEKILEIINVIIGDERIIADVLDKLQTPGSSKDDELLNDLQIMNLEFENLSKRQGELDEAYFANKLKAENYNRLVENVNTKLNDIDLKIKAIEKEMALNKPIEITPAIIREAFENFTKAFEVADDEDKKLLIRSLIKEIYVTDDRKKLKNISFWFFDTNDLPANDEWRTLP
ncbi:site-specific DNA recombinase [Peribacillus deserti]|uniref:Site-specific DNA recombinase n=1 Tax=Peribacillus deserti TaxID=673318 RepID=A0ABS2QK21_9BACI|nr:recombinase family protein [Peribacillus deserti]MBM7693526.1 site-specific DNA recombinase [Peribacillus deserti]